MPTDMKITRRQALAAAGATLAFGPALRALAADEKRLFKIGACDWSIGKARNVAALEVAKAIGLDGVQVSFGPPGGQFDLREAAVRKQYLDGCRRHGVEIASLAMGVLLDEQVVLLAFFGKGDIKGKPDAQKEVIRRLKKVAPAAEKAGVVLGIESWLNADDHLAILDAVGSPAVQVYYDVANMHYSGYDIYKEIRQLGRERICEIHAKERGVLLGGGPIDFKKVKVALDDIGWTGWLIIEGATERGRSMEDCYRDNQKFLRSVFPTAA